MFEEIKIIEEFPQSRFMDSFLGKESDHIDISDFFDYDESLDDTLYTADDHIGDMLGRESVFFDYGYKADEEALKGDVKEEVLENDGIEAELSESLEASGIESEIFDGGIENELLEADGTENENLKTDDEGNVYCVDDKLQPYNTYVLNGNTYNTDEFGRIVECDASPIRSPENPRDVDAQLKAGGEDRLDNDQGGHIVGRDLNGDSGIGNLVAMDSKINQSDYKRMENDIKSSLDEGKDVTVKTEISYSDNSERPDRLTSTVNADGVNTVYKFDNNLDGSLRDEVPESGKEVVQNRLDDTGGEISSIKEEYGEDSSLKETTVYITYRDENGTYYRTNVVIDGGNGND